MNKNIMKLMSEIEVNITSIENTANRYFENIEDIKKECENVLGFKKHHFWHMNFNSSEINYLDNVFTSKNCYSFSSFNERIENKFKIISDAVGVDKDILIFLYNDFLIYKEKGMLNNQ